MTDNRTEPKLTCTHKHIHTCCVPLVLHWTLEGNWKIKCIKKQIATIIKRRARGGGTELNLLTRARVTSAEMYETIPSSMTTEGKECRVSLRRRWWYVDWRNIHMNVSRFPGASSIQDVISRSWHVVRCKVRRWDGRFANYYRVSGVRTTQHTVIQ